jgi:hypothetical protein
MRETSRWIVAALLLALLAGCGNATPGASPTTKPAAPVPAGSSSPAAIGPSGSSTGSGPTGTAKPPTTPTVTRAATASTVQITRAGTIAGINQSIVIAVDGAWTLTDRRKGVSRQGRLNAAQLAQLRTLLGDPQLAAEAAQKAPPGVCSDGLISVLTAGSLVVRDDGCGVGNHPATQAVLSFVASVIPT